MERYEDQAKEALSATDRLNERRTRRSRGYWLVLPTLLAIWALFPLAYAALPLLLLAAPLLLISTILVARFMQPPALHHAWFSPTSRRLITLLIALSFVILSTSFIVYGIAPIWGVPVIAAVALWFSAHFIGRAIDRAQLQANLSHA